jgi:hypothetical protein
MFSPVPPLSGSTHYGQAFHHALINTTKKNIKLIFKPVYFIAFCDIDGNPPKFRHHPHTLAW